MKQAIAGAKLGRLIFLLENNSNAKVLADALIAKNITGATAASVKDPGGSHLEYRFKLPTDTDAGWVKKRALRIAKKFVDDYNQAAQEAYDAAVAANQNPEELDLDSDETKIAVAIAWIRASVKGDVQEIDPDVDLVNIIALSGKIDATNLLIEVKPAGQIADNGKTYQRRLKTTRLNISTVTPDDPITVTSLNHSEIRLQLIDALDLPIQVEGEEAEVRSVFEEDVLLQMTHYKVGSRYTAVISNTALDYYGEIEFTVAQEEENPEPVINDASYDSVTGDLSYTGPGPYYTYSHIFDPATSKVQVETPDFALVEDFHLGFKLTVNGANGTDYVEVVDNLQGTPSRLLKRLTGAGPIDTDTTLEAIEHSRITVEVTGDVVNVTIKDLSETPVADEVRQYTMSGFGPVAGEKLFISLVVDVNPENVPGNPSTVATNVKIVDKAVLP